MKVRVYRSFSSFFTQRKKKRGSQRANERAREYKKKIINKTKIKQKQQKKKKRRKKKEKNQHKRTLAALEFRVIIHKTQLSTTAKKRGKKRGRAYMRYTLWNLPDGKSSLGARSGRLSKAAPRSSLAVPRRTLST
jgi:hypothetical protein